MNRFLRRRWTRFTHPAGRLRLWHLGGWRWNERILVLGESIALVSAVLGLASEMWNWHSTNWFLLATPIVGSASLLWYAWDTVTVGDRPLSSASIHNIRQVVQATLLEDAGAVVDWQHPDDEGSIPLRIE